MYFYFPLKKFLIYIFLNCAIEIDGVLKKSFNDAFMSHIMSENIGVGGVACPARDNAPSDKVNSSLGSIVRSPFTAATARAPPYSLSTRFPSLSLSCETVAIYSTAAIAVYTAAVDQQQ